MMDGLKLSIPQRMKFLRITLTFSLIISIFLSAQLWGGYRSFPYAPVIRNHFIQPPFDVIFTGLAVLFWLASLFLKKQRLFIFMAFALCVLLVLLDLNRLQPWFYIYNSLLAVFIFYNGRVDDPNKFTSVFIILQLIVASVYFYCGLSQLNAVFVNTEFVNLISPLKSMMSERQFLFFKKMGATSPYLLLFVGLGLIISPLRYIASSIAVCMHLLLLVFLFPSAAHADYALWFSNLSFLVMLLLLFSGKTKQRYFSPTFLFRKPVFYLVALFFLAMPAFNVVNRWPDFLSSNFKSGNTNSAGIQLTGQVKNRLPLYLRSFCSPSSNGRYDFDFKRWALHELHAECYPATPVFNSIYKHLQDLTGTGVKDIQLQPLPKQKLLCKP
jgi:hypothetical protein